MPRKYRKGNAMNKAEVLQMGERLRQQLGIGQHPEIPELRRAVCRLVDITGQLHACGYITDEMAATWPSFWILHKPLDLEVVGDTTAQDERWAAYELARGLYREACQIWHQLSPLWRATQHLCETLGRLQWQAKVNGEPQLTLADPSCLRALRGVSDLLCMFASHNPALLNYAQRLDELLNKLRDEARTLLVRRYLDGAMTDAQARECVALLEADAESGRWDPDEIEAVADQLNRDRAVVQTIGRVA
jgi:hypothetical protein